MESDMADVTPPKVNVKALLETQEVQGELCVNTGAICKYLGIILNKDFIIDTLGVPPFVKMGIAGLWRVSDLKTICSGLENHIAQKAKKL
jgi:hypothetical protein